MADESGDPESGEHLDESSDETDTSYNARNMDESFPPSIATMNANDISAVRIVGMCCCPCINFVFLKLYAMPLYD